MAAALTRLLRDGAAGHRWAAATVGSESAAAQITAWVRAHSTAETFGGVAV